MQSRHYKIRVVSFTELQITLDVTSIHIHSAISKPLFTKVLFEPDYRAVEAITRGFIPVYF